MSNYIRLDRFIERGPNEVQMLGIDNAKLNVNGGAIAIGHPLGCSGARLATTLIHQMARTGASRGIASLCVGVGQGLATIFEREGVWKCPQRNLASGRRGDLVKCQSGSARPCRP